MGVSYQFEPGANWRFLFSTHRYSAHQLAPPSSAARYERVPMDDYILPVFPNSHICALRVTSDGARSPRGIGAYLRVTYPVAYSSNFPEVRAGSRRLYRGNWQLVELRNRGQGASMILSFPWWIPDLKIECFEYTGPITDSTEQTLVALQADLARIEQKIDAL